MKISQRVKKALKQNDLNMLNNEALIKGMKFIENMKAKGALLPNRESHAEILGSGFKQLKLFSFPSLKSRHS